MAPLYNSFSTLAFNIYQTFSDLLLWYNRISSFLEALGHGFNPWPTQWVKDRALPQLWLSIRMWLGSNPHATEWPKKKKCFQCVCHVKHVMLFHCFVSICVWCYVFPTILQTQTLFLKFLMTIHQNIKNPGTPHTNQVRISRGRARESFFNKVPTWRSGNEPTSEVWIQTFLETTAL